MNVFFVWFDKYAVNAAVCMHELQCVAFSSVEYLFSLALSSQHCIAASHSESLYGLLKKTFSTRCVIKMSKEID